jgi:hypothetical protein
MDNSKSDIREIGLVLARSIAGLAVDPHGYFEKKYIARIEHAHSDQEVRGVLAQLVQWATSGSVSDAERQTLDRELGQRGMPTVEDLQANLLF